MNALSPHAQALAHQLSALTVDEQDAVWAATLSLAEFDAQWREALSRRRAALEAGQMSTLTREQAAAELRTRIAACSSQMIGA